MASYLGFLNQKYILQRGLSLFVCTLFLLLIYHTYKSETKQRDGKHFHRNSTPKTVYKLLNEKDVFPDNGDSNGTVQLKTFYNTTLNPPGVILEPKGGIGNQLYQYACSYALAKDLGWPLYLQLDLNRKSFLPSHRQFQPTHREFALDQFQIQFENIIDKTTEFSAKVNKQTDRTFLERTFLDVPDPENQFVILSNYCQSIEYWKKYEKEIRAMFQPRKSAINIPKLQKIINKIRNSEVSVVVHVRRGDYVVPRYFIPTSYHRYAMRKMISMLKAKGKEKPVFFVFSDDIAHAERKLKDFAETYEMVFVRREITNATSIEDFYLMTMCKHIIIPNSTYGWWAAYLIKNKDKIVIASTHNPIYYTGFMGNDYFYQEKYGKLYHPKSWTVIDPFTGGLEKSA